MLIKLGKTLETTVRRLVFGRSWRLVLAMIVLAATLLARHDWGDWSGEPGRIAGHADVRDGDSLVIGRQRIRLEGIDAPELAQMCTRGGKPWACGKDARRHLARLIGNHKVECLSSERDKHNRLLGRCSAVGRDLNRSMVSDGMAVSFGRAYSREETAARRDRQGMWAGKFERPQQWRRKNQRR